ncbi:hypothetical protein [Rheinheimera sp.]|uniref:DUF4097 family beta strand repeat-containing protein n=1 Tax=Rheinheimera sp. TaxID=1869214 RepID=UPI0027BAB8CD|nr:hypothetical protein [Rheinheimera sp.]
MKKFIPHTLTLALVSGLLLPQLAFAAGAPVNEAKNVSANEKIYIENMRGHVEIKAVKSPAFSVKGTLDEKAEGFDFTSKDGITRFVVKMPRTNFGWGDHSDKEGSQLVIEVPEGSALEFSGVNSSVSVTGVAGSSKIHTVNGTITAKQLSNDVELETVNGEIDSIGNSGRVRLNTVNGSIDDEGSSGRVNVESVNGEINLQSSAKEIEVSVVNGEAELMLSGTERLDYSSVNGEIRAAVTNSKAPRINASSVSGSSILKLDADVSARFKLVASAGGDINNKITEQKADKAKYGPRRSLEFSTGSGDGSIDMSTVSGELRVEKN